eukprot:5581186-Amphidinium_carterae.1
MSKCASKPFLNTFFETFLRFGADSEELTLCESVGVQGRQIKAEFESVNIMLCRGQWPDALIIETSMLVVLLNATSMSKRCRDNPM